jgi:mannose-6-phosphate isomerase-like protein (cupin superfamily)
MTDTTTATAADRLTVGGDEISFQVTSDMSGGSLVAYDAWLAPGGGPPALHRHAAFELFRVERGELTFYLGDGHGKVVRSVAEAGAVVAIQSGQEHTVRNESGQEAHAFVVLSPGDAMERFARAAGEIESGDPSGPAQILALAREHGIEITRPLEGVEEAGSAV